MRYYIAHMMEADLEEVVELEEMTGLSRWGYDGYLSDLLYNPMAVMLVVRGDEPAAMFRRVLAFLVARVVPSPLEPSDEIHINNIATHPDFRGMGIGKALMKEATSIARIYGARRATLEVRASNLAAQNMYLNLGFEIVGRRRNYYSFPEEDALIMESLLF